MTNKEIAAAFKLTGALMELHGENAFRTRSYTKTYSALRKLENPLSEMTSAEIAAIPGVGKSSIEKIDELLTNGVMQRLEGYRKKTPPGVVELLSIRGLGPGKVRTVWQDLGIESPGELLYACNENRLIEARGFGLKTQADVRQKLIYYLESKDKWLFARIEPIAIAILDLVRGVNGGTRADFVGELARACPVINTVEIIAEGITADTVLDQASFSRGPEGLIYDGKTPFRLHVANEGEYLARKFALTGSSEFVQGLVVSESADTEHAIFEENDLPFVIPEMREESDAAMRAIAHEEYITDEDLKGIVHNHSTYSDGLNTLREMAEYVQQSGYEYFGISDHSRTAVYANGLSVDRLEQQWEEIDDINRDMTPFRVFKGIESDILHNGSLDYPDEILRQFDFVVASIHSGLKMDEERATSRLISAIENPFTDILGHPTGRLLLSRQGYPIDHKRVIDACAANGVALELNANPLRLDIDYTWLPYAIEKEVYVSINPDAHSKEGIHHTRFGVLAARKGGLPKSRCLNALSCEDFEKWLRSRR